MTVRTMGDATHSEVPALAAVAGGLELVAGYVTGSPDIQWTAEDWQRFAGKIAVTIDQGFTGSPVADAMVRDVEPGAWQPATAADRSGWNTPRPTIYCNRYDLSRAGGVLASGWQGDLWLAIPGWVLGEPLPSAPGCTIVAVQHDYRLSYDLSAVLDDTWPAAPPVPQPPNWTEQAVQQLPTIGQGATGPAVRTLQGCLIARGYHVGTSGPLRDGIDGDFGPLTSSAVRALQGTAGITVDGIAGPQTWPHALGVA